MLCRTQYNPFVSSAYLQRLKTPFILFDTIQISIHISCNRLQLLVKFMVSDFVIAGAGHNSLITACYLAKAGFSCTVIDARDVPGGGCATEEMFGAGSARAQETRPQRAPRADAEATARSNQPSDAARHAA